MKRRDYFIECNRLSNVFSEKHEAVQAHLENDPNLEGEGSYEKYWDLQNEASTAAIAWTNFCAEHRSSLES